MIEDRDLSQTAPLARALPPPSIALYRFPHRAMNCLWELYLIHADARYAENAANAAFAEVNRLEQELSRFIEHSDIGQINQLPAGRPLRIGADAFACLELAAQVHAETGGAFDVTVGSLLRRVDEVEALRERTAASPANAGTPARHVWGMHLLALDRPTRRVVKLADGLVLDLGGIGKGYAVDQVAATLREWSIAAGLIHSGQSSLYALGAPPGADAWTIAIRDPAEHAKSLGAISMRDAALSGSGILLHGRHIIDPRTGEPAGGAAVGSWALAASAALSDAASTAFMIMSIDDVAAYCASNRRVSGLLCLETTGGREVRHFGTGLRLTTEA